MIFLLHGLLGSPIDWDPICPLLKAPCLSLPLPGHDHEPFSNPNTYLCQKITKPSVLIGYSLGGRLAIDFATQFPKRISHLIILSANPGIEEQKQRTKRLDRDESWAHMIDERGFPSFLKNWYQQPLFNSLRNRSNFSDIFKKRLKQDPESMKQALLKLSPAILPSRWNAIKTFSFPMLFLFGEYDTKYQLIRNRLADMGVRTDLVPNSGHAIHLENPKACAQKIEEFLS